MTDAASKAVEIASCKHCGKCVNVDDRFGCALGPTVMEPIERLPDDRIAKAWIGQQYSPDDLCSPLAVAHVAAPIPLGRVFALNIVRDHQCPNV